MKLTPDPHDDDLNLTFDKNAIQTLQKHGKKGERVFFSADVSKINRRGKEQKRVLMVTDKAVYNLIPHSHKSKRRIDFKQIASISTSNTSKEFAIHVEQENDYRYRSIFVKRIVELLQELFLYRVNRNLPWRVVETASLKDITVTEKLNFDDLQADHDDGLNLRTNSKATKMLERNAEEGEIIYFSGNVDKFNRHNKTQKRVLCITDGAFYTLPHNDYKNVKRRIAVTDIAGFTLSETSHEFIVHVNQDFDNRYRTPKKDAIVELICRFYSTITGEDLEITRIPQASLQGLDQHKGDGEDQVRSHTTLPHVEVQDRELDNKFQRWLTSKDVAPQDAQVLRGLPSTDKWALMADESKDVDQEEMASILKQQQKVATNWVKKLTKTGDSETLRRFRQAIGSQKKTGATWLGQFVKHQGLDTLLNIGKLNQEDSLCMDVLSTFKNIIEVDHILLEDLDALAEICSWFGIQNNPIRCLILDLLSYACWCSSEGHELVCDAFRKISRHLELQQEYSSISASSTDADVSIFPPLLNTLREENRICNVVTRTVVFISVIISLFDDPRDRVDLRVDLQDQGFQGILEELRDWCQENPKDANFKSLESLIDVYGKETIIDETEAEMVGLQEQVDQQMEELANKNRLMREQEIAHARTKHQMAQKDKTIQNLRQDIFTTKQEYEQRLADGEQKFHHEKIEAGKHLIKDYGASLEDVHEFLKIEISEELQAFWTQLEEERKASQEYQNMMTNGSGVGLVKPDMPAPPPPGGEHDGIGPAPAAAAPPPPPGMGAPPPPGGGPPPPPLAAPPPLLMELQKPALPPKPTITPNVKMKQFHWQVVPVRQVESTIWGDLTDERVELKIEELEAQFAAKTISKPKPGQMNFALLAQQAAAKKEEVQIIDSKRRYNIDIGLSRFKLQPGDICDALIQMDEKELDLDKLQKLYNFLPSPSEISEVLEYDGDIKHLATAEKFFLALSPIKNVKNRVQAMLFRLQFDNQSEEVDQNIDLVRDALDELRNSKALRRVFEIILAIGNYVNGGSRKGGAYGFKLSSLSQISGMKSTDNTKSMMNYIVEYIDKECPDNRVFLTNLGHVEAAQRVDQDSLRGEVKSIEEGLQQVEESVRHEPCSEMDRFPEVMGNFLADRSKTYEDIKIRFDSAESNLKELLTLFGERESKWEDLFSHFKKFVSNYKQAQKENERRQKMRERLAKREAALSGTSVGRRREEKEDDEIVFVQTVSSKKKRQQEDQVRERAASQPADVSHVMGNLISGAQGMSALRDRRQKQKKKKKRKKKKKPAVNPYDF